ncbi:MAG TPA: NADH:flavin oxidoreductase [Caulobacteraceae bacterium]|jgi:2,4-dienoyl-CoA reductase-like NADH-dependent reductase (Old Yellow Enzyme family)|nr:NADH:flavin oxidoreductase [Caulobacteraceae bacterium]
MTSLSESLSFLRGPAMENRVALAPMTSDQATIDGRVTEDELRWLGMRARGGFGLVMTSAAYVQPDGKVGKGQFGIFSDDHVEGYARLASTIKATGRVSALQLHHGGYRCPTRCVPQPVGPSDDPESGSRALTTAEVEQLVESFVQGALRAQRAGFDGVELHGAHGYIITQFLSLTDNRREDRYGGSLENRSRIVFEIIDGVRRVCRPDFQLGLRLSPERYGLRLAEIRDLAAELMRQGKIDYLDLSLWDAGKEPVDPEFHGRPLISYFTELPRAGVRLGAAGKIMSAPTAATVVEAGADFILIGRAAILHHDFASLVLANSAFAARALPVTLDYLAVEGLGARFLRYITTFEGFVDMARATT